MVTVPHKMVRLEKMLNYRGFTVHTILHGTLDDMTFCIYKDNYIHITVNSEILAIIKFGDLRKIRL